ncbi:MAG: DUF983 domain-containing protein [Alphaproteobacteria bacterium]
MSKDPYFPRRTSSEAIGIGLATKCPRCAKAPLYRSFLKVQPTCPSCGLDLSREDSGDGPAAFLIFIIGGIVLLLALIVELAAQPPYWLHVLIWFPLVFLLYWLIAPRAKAIFIAMQYHTKSSDSGTERYK